MSRLILVTGGARSGKSSHAEGLVKEMGSEIGYIATAKVTDEDMKRKIEHHRNSRPEHWSTIEKYKDFQNLDQEEAFKNCDTFLLDCLTILITNQMFEHDLDYDTCDVLEVEKVEAAIRQELTDLTDIMRDNNKNLVIVSNEVGLGLVPSYRLGNLFRDIAGRMNQYIAAKADEAMFIVSGLPIKLK